MPLNINFLWNIVTCTVLFILLVKNITRHTLREAIVCFLFAQVVTWAFSTFFVELHWETCPVRLFPRATRTDFVGDYFTAPVIYALFYFQYIKHRSCLFRCCL
ncbi:CBO0543 family protein [Paenibacillus aestuarii]|uniref:CBO0543 family protein n=1 Tax=Paenibacillus aestuarii TaxID=516965 RepID=A0ABW0KF72_9BACL